MNCKVEVRNGDVCLYIIDKDGERIADISLTWEQAEDLQVELDAIMIAHYMDFDFDKKGE